MSDNIKYWIAFSRVSGFGPAKFNILLKYFNHDLKTAWSANSDELRHSGLDEKTLNQIIIQRNEINPDQELFKLEKENIKVVTLENDNYPKLLKEIYNPPSLLYYKGNLSMAQDEFTITVVGSRNFSSYGKQIVFDIVSQLAEHGITIVSGLAIGIDGLAHEATLKVGGRTLAVLGSGVDQQSIYPSRNRYTSQQIIQNNGAIISEFPIGTNPMPFNFPYRNRILAGMSLGTLVVEATEKSGSLITTKYALEFNREIFAVPGNIYHENSQGPNKLIQMGAKAVASAKDILEALDLTAATQYIETKKIIPDSQEEQTILAHLSKEPLHIDELTRLANLPAHQISATLTLMEIKGKIRNLGNSMYVIAR